MTKEYSMTGCDFSRKIYSFKEIAKIDGISIAVVLHKTIICKLKSS